MDYSYSDRGSFACLATKCGAQEAFLATLAPDDLQPVLRYTNRKGEVWEYALWRMIHHVVIHSTYHRGQVTNMLRLLGAQAATTDFLEFWDERQTGG